MNNIQFKLWEYTSDNITFQQITSNPMPYAQFKLIDYPSSLINLDLEPKVILQFIPMYKSDSQFIMNQVFVFQC